MTLEDEKTIPEPPRMLKYGITPLDLFILNELDKGTAEATITENIKKEFGKKCTRYQVRQIIKSLKNRDILLKENGIVVNPAKLFADIYLAFIKTNVHGIPALTWQEAFQRIIQINDSHGRPIRILFNIGGTGEYDFVALIYSNDPEKYHEFKADLVKMTGIIEKFDTKYADVPHLLLFDPIAIPDFRGYREVREYYKKELEREESFTEEIPEGHKSA